MSVVLHDITHTSGNHQFIYLNNWKCKVNSGRKQIGNL
jgi:hypothetical protein